MLSSALEHTVPEQMFSTATQKAQVVSTVKLLNLAAQQGIPILHITPANSAITIPSLKLAPEVITEIQTAVAVGKEVIVHQNNITAFGWTGAGYVVLDPVTGDAAWRISGVRNGCAYCGLNGCTMLNIQDGTIPFLLFIVSLIGFVFTFPSMLLAIVFIMNIMTLVFAILIVQIDMEVAGCPNTLAILATALLVASLSFLKLNNPYVRDMAMAIMTFIVEGTLRIVCKI